MAARRQLAATGLARGADRIPLFLRLIETLARIPRRRHIFQGLPRDAAPAMRLKMETYAEALGLAEVVQHFGLAQQAFSRLFKRQTGHTFARYLVLTRICAACSTLPQSHQPVTDICFEVGHKNIANFNRRFFKVCGRRPSDYRRSE